MSVNPSERAPKRSKGKAIGLTILFAVLFCLASTAALWFTPLSGHLIALVALDFILTGFFALLCYWLLRKGQETTPSDPTAQLLINKHKKLLTVHFKRMLKIQKRKKHFTSPYDQPIYLLLSADLANDRSIITQMGYEAYKVDDFGNDIEFPILFWLSEHSILISISQADDQHPEYIKTLCKNLNAWRPRQAINGILLTTDVSQLLQNNEKIAQHADELKSHLKAYNHTFGLNLPIYNIVTNMGNISDFCQFFSAFDETKRDEVFGATSPYQKHGGIDATWYDQEFDHLISQLIANISTAQAGQLNQDYRNAIACAPFQFGLLKQSLWVMLQRLYRGDQLSDGLQFRGFYFTHNGQAHQQSDVLASVVNHQLGHEFYLQNEQIPVQQTLFAQHIMTHVVLGEHQLVGVNKRKENTLMVSQLSYGLAWVILLGAVLTAIKLDFDYQSSREARADRMLERYKEAISAAPYDLENMAENIPNLYSMRAIYELYLKPEPWYSLSFLPDPNIKKDVAKAYFQELQQVLIPSLENTLEKDLFVYVNLEEQAKTLSLLNNYRLLFDKQRTNTQELRSYFIASLQDQGEADSANIAQLGTLLDDVFARGLVPVKINTDLESLAKKVINQTGVETLLYDHIRNSSMYAKRLDVRSDLGDNFNQLFSFSPGYIGYLVPYIYTPAGFNELDLSADSPLIKQALLAYEGVAGDAPSSIELYRISRDLKQSYQNDYINYWRDFISHIQVTPITSSAELDRTLNTLTNASGNPLTSLYQTVTKYTSVELESASTAAQPATEAAAEDEVQDVDKKESARQISLSFQAYHQLVTPDQQNQKPLDTLLANVAKTKSWLDKYYQSKQPQQLAYQTLASSLKADDPVSTLALQAADQQAIIAGLLNDITAQCNELMLLLSHEYLNSAWQSEVYQPYQQTLASFYPFNPKASSDASVADVKAFFKSGGTLDTFYTSKLASFTSQGNASPFLNGLLPNTGLALDPELWSMLSKGQSIRQALFLTDPNNVSVSFQIKAVEMSPSLTEFAITSDKPIFSYRHGPLLWSAQTWQGESQLEDTLGIEVISPTTAIAKESYNGNWNWFRLIAPRVKESSEQTTQIEFKYGDNKVQLAIKTQGQSNPFQPGFFSGFSLPNDI